MFHVSILLFYFLFLLSCIFFDLLVSAEVTFSFLAFAALLLSLFMLLVVVGL